MRFTLGLSFALLLGCSSAPERAPSTSNKNETIQDKGKDSLNSSSGKKPSDSSSGKTDNTSTEDAKVEKEKLSAQRLVIKDAKVLQDALEYTSAKIEFNAQGAAPFTLSGLYLYDLKLAELNAQEKSALGKPCEEINLTGNTELLEFSWKSHKSKASTEALTTAIAKGHKALSCVVLLRDSKGANHYLSLDPVPASASGSIGAQDLKKAVEAGIMLAQADSNLTIDTANLYKVATAGKPLDSVKSIRGKILQASYSKEAGELCAFASNSTTTVSQPSNPKSFQISVDSVKVKSATPLAITGKILKACANVQLTFKESIVDMKFTCGDYQETRNEGLEAGCQWTVAVENALDSEDQSSVIISMPKLSYKAATAKNWASGKDLVPASPKNPIRLNSVRFNGFGANETKFLEKAFDIILEVAPDIYASDFENYIRTANYSTTGSCATNGVMGFARINGTEVNLCRYMFGAGIDSPNAIVGAAHTIIHEVRHAKGFYHDIDRPNYEACKGTAYSNVFDHNIVVTCKSAFCPLLKAAAEGSYMNDINYSLRNDDRRFEGQCKTWQNAMGFTDARVKAGR